MKIIIKKLLSYIIRARNFNKCKFGSSVLLRGSCCFGGKNHIGNRSIFYNSSIGYASYMGDQNVFVNVKIGRYCSLGSDIAVVASTHPLNNMVSTHPAFYSCDFSHLSYVEKTKFQEILLNEEGRACTIGNDVWIGDHVRIKGGVTIGDGAVIGMGCIVTKDVPPYAVVGGVPAKIIKYRFDDDSITTLLKLKWWNRSEEWLKEHAEEFSDAERFLKRFEEKNNESM